MWFVYSIITLLFWGLADLFYKKGAKEEDKYSHLKTGIMVGLVMGIHATGYILIKGIDVNLLDLLKYLPVSFFYISSMIIGYKGLKYLELSIASPVQNCSGVITSLLLFLIFREKLPVLDIIGIGIIAAGIVFLSIVERKDKKITIKKSKITFSVITIIFPLIYCILDGMGTFLDAIYLDKLSLITEDAALIAYEYTFFLYGLIVFAYLKFKKKERINILEEKDKLVAAIFETAGQFFYVFAVARNSTIAIPIISMYSVASIVFAHIFLKEKLNKKEYITIIIVLIGIIVLGISEGIHS